ncbi:FadR/GntR family transcriptional regulator [Robertmurraya kyonggiensis]|uniref:FadR family transcriptional regulator n=1 Tax=Robertmurraya kyonggiensis TaxID=1037680 RepID=A0A4U1D640_9BACI|nr:FadR/GntR family transcriptional regulator [Robertmurraya kyonggiensis]TKC18099.1 FadR family transcriptional regulator [Robertmurraya kyonggiensis]
MEFEPIRKQKRIYQVIIDQIKQAIEQGQIKPGDKLPSERMLAETLCVSRTSVKEAITVLETAGIVRVRPGVGMFLIEDSHQSLLSKFSEVIASNKTKFTDLFELRQAIEGDAAFYAASRITEEQKEKLTVVFNELVLAEKLGEVASKEDFRFHFTIVEAANNPVMLEVMNLISDKMIHSLAESRETSMKNQQLNNEVQLEHRHIYEAIMNNSPEQARQAAWVHLQGIKQRYIHRISQQKMERNQNG